MADEGRLSRGLYRTKQSMTHPSIDIRGEFFLRSLQHEERLITSARSNIPLALYKQLRRNTESGQALNWRSARKMALVESSANLLKNPLILATIPEFQQFYRLMRVLELTGKIKRGGDTVFIGSGATIPELLAMYALPASENEIDRVYGFEQKDNALLLEVGKSLGIYEHGQTGVQTTKAIPLLPGKAIAIEPDTRESNKATNNARMYSVPTNKYQILPITLGDAFDSGALDGITIQNIVWNRAEPDMVSEGLRSLQQVSSENEVAQILSRFFSIMVANKSQSRLVITAGHGNDQASFNSRKNLLLTVNKLLSSLNAQNLVEDSTLLSDKTDKDLCGGSYGVIGCVVAKLK